MADKNTNAETDKQPKSKSNRQQPRNQWRTISNNVWHNVTSKGYWSNFYISLVFFLISPFFALYMNNLKAGIILVAIALTILIWSLTIVVIRNLSPPEMPETELHGYLIPAKDPSPKTPCKKRPPNAVTIFVGGNAVWITDSPVVIVRVDDVDLLTLNNASNGLSISAKVFSDDSKIVADIENNEFSVNPNNYFKVKRPDKSSLIVYDQQARDVLNIRFLNPANIRVSGIFNAPNQKPVIIDDEKIFRPSQFTGNCWGKIPYIIQIKGEENSIGGFKLL